MRTDNKKRDLARTRDRILRAALAEFCAKGPDGARTAAIARRARVAHRMVFYCFGSKTRLYREVLRHKLSERAAVLEATPANFSEALLYWYQAANSDPDWVRLQTWEALAAWRGRLAAQEERRELFRRLQERFEHWQQQGVLPGEVDPKQLLISVVGLALFPCAFPQFAILACEMAPQSPDFAQARREFLAWLGGRISSSSEMAHQADDGAADLRRAKSQLQ